MLKLRDYQQKVKSDLYQHIKNGTKKTLIVAGTGAGKCLGKGTPILMYDGTVKAVENVVIGDKLMGDDSTPRTVLSLASGQENLYKITPVKGNSWVCNASHILSLQSTADKGKFKNHQIYDIPMNEYINFGVTHKHVLKQYRVGVTQFDNQSDDLPVDPWLLGLFIGDGHKGLGSIHLNDNTKLDVATKAASVMVQFGYRPSSSREQSNHGVRLAASMNTATEKFIDHVRKAWDGKQLNAHNIYIPHKYKTSSVDNRLAILAGLIDSDGSYDGRSISFTTVSKTLADDVCFISRSLGLAAYPTLRQTKCNGKLFPSYRVSISGELSDIPCVQWDIATRKQKKSVLRTGFTVESLGIGDYYGFTIDGNHRFLLGDFTVTHNTECACAIVQDILSRDRRVAFLVHRDNLVRQTASRFEKYGLNPSIVAGGHPCDESNPCQVVSMQTLERRKSALPLVGDVAIYDEAHLTAWRKSGKSMILNGHHQITIGLTATPWRLSKREEMGDLFDELVLAPVPSQLIEMGYLSQAKYYGLSGADLNGVKTVAGDFALDDLSVLCNDNEVVDKAVGEWQRLAEGKTTIVFCVDVAHAKHMAESFKQSGIAADYVSGDMCPVKIREPLYADLKSGKLTVLCACNALSEGFDVPNIECVILARPTKSKAIYVQQLGRGLRLSEGKEFCLVLDQAGNIKRHGFIEDLTPSDFALRQADDKPPGDAPVKECPECGCLHRTFDMVCPECGYEYPLKEKVKQKGELVELRKFECDLPLSGQLYREWRKEAYNKGIAPGYAMAKFRELHPDQWPNRQWSLGAVFDGDDCDFNQELYLGYLQHIAFKKEKDDNWVRREFKNEFGIYPDNQLMEAI